MRDFLWLLATAVVLLGIAARAMRRRAMHRWLLPSIRHAWQRRGKLSGEIHVLLCIADHFEPRNGDVSADVARRRVENWVEWYPRLFGDLRDSDGQPPRHTFFYPLEQYDALEVDALAELCRRGFGEVEIHLHHDRDNSDALRQRLSAYKEMLAERHGLLARHRDSGELAYGFVHGNWALDNSHPRGLHCGVNDELNVLRETGCYADFTMPSAPDSSQVGIVNSIYYAVDDPNRPRSHEAGIKVGTAPAPADGLMLIQGPLTLDWASRKWGIFPRIENGCLQANQPPTMSRLENWLSARVQVPARPDWFFVKLYTHGAPEHNQRVLLGDPMIRFHEDLAALSRARRDFHFHYLTAREMYNLVRAAEAGWTGSVNDARDWELVWSPVNARRERAIGVSPAGVS